MASTHSSSANPTGNPTCEMDVCWMDGLCTWRRPVDKGRSGSTTMIRTPLDPSAVFRGKANWFDSAPKIFPGHPQFSRAFLYLYRLIRVDILMLRIRTFAPNLNHRTRAQNWAPHYGPTLFVASLVSVEATSTRFRLFISHFVYTDGGNEDE